ncbi:MAG: hypothetical protein Kow0077_31270 [Anaerolineae bacterium]
MAEPIRREQRTFVNYDPPISRPAPLLSVGPLAWIRRNLFSSLLDTFLTVMSVFVIVGVTIGVAGWSIRQANWFVITFNVRQFMLGRYDALAEWRVHLSALLVMFVMGIAVAAFTRLRWRTFLWLALAMAVLFIIPIVINTTINLPPSYLTAGNTPVVTGSVSQATLEDLSFIAAAGEEVSVNLADSLVASEEALAAQAGFGDKALNGLRNAAANRQAALARQAELQRLLATDLLTEGQREQYTAELERLEIGEPVLEAYALNQAPTVVRITHAASGEVLGEAVLEAGSDPLTVTVPETGWYLLHKAVEGDDPSVSVLAVQGLYPILERNFTLSETVGPDGEVIPARRVNQFIRMVDGLLVEEPRPQIDGQDVPFAIIIDNQYRGERPVRDYLRIFLSPFLAQINPGILQALLVFFAGFGLGRLADRFFSLPEKPKRASVRTATWTMIALPAVVFVLIYGFGGPLPITDTRNWGGLLLTMMLTMVGIIGAFPLGVLLALGRRSNLPVVKGVSTLYIEMVRGVPLITVLFMAQLLVPFLNPALANVDNVFRAMVGITLFSAAYLAENVRGGLQAIPPGQVEAARALGLAGWHTTLLITLPQALRAVIPALVGQFISLFKDTSLVAIVGLIDLTGISNAVIAQTEFIGLRREAYIFITIIYFIFSYVMSWVSRRIEATGSGAVTRG